MSLHLAPCSREAAEYAVLNWHYSQRMPTGRLFFRGVWENGSYIGAVIFGRGANDRMLRPFNLKQSQGCELVRVALTDHEAPVSQIVAESLRQLRKINPGLRIVVSYADPEHSHHGGIYQAGNWLYLGVGGRQYEWIINGRRYHSRSVSAMYTTARGSSRIREGESRLEWLRRTKDSDAYFVRVPGKHRYVMPLDKAMRRQVRKLALPYPSPAVEGSEETRHTSGVESQVRSLTTAQRSA